MGLITDSIESLNSKKKRMEGADPENPEINQDDNYFNDDFDRQLMAARNRRRAKFVEVG